jgi:hypothetical protein
MRFVLTLLLFGGLSAATYITPAPKPKGPATSGMQKVIFDGLRKGDELWTKFLREDIPNGFKKADDWLFTELDRLAKWMEEANPQDLPKIENTNRG